VAHTLKSKKLGIFGILPTIIPMNKEILQRNGGTCELCQKANATQVYDVEPLPAQVREVALCTTCLDALESAAPLDEAYWQFLPDNMWSEQVGIQVLAYRLLHRLKRHAWAADSLDILYLDEEALAWAQADLKEEEGDEGPAAIHQDANGNPLADGDTVVLIKTLDVKGSSLSAKLGTVVKNIRLVPDNTDQIEGRVEGQLIVILTKYLRKQN
jgi:protein PhnA